jgi:DNA polymerase III gamma/tau subunit
MKIANLTNAAAVLALGLAAGTAGTAQAQPLYDRVNVNLPYTVTIGDKTLPPGNYVIQQLESPGEDSRVVLIYSDNGMKFQTSAMSIPALDAKTPEDTKIILHQVGSDYYLDKIWIQGKDYGYEFPLPNSVKSREKEMAHSVSVPANYSSSKTTETSSTTQPANSANTANSATTSNSSNNTTNSADTTANTQPANPSSTATPNTSTQQAMNPTPNAPAETTAPPVVDNSPATNNTNGNMSAQNTQPSQPSQSMQSSADRSMNENADRSTDTNAMPHTSAGWLMMLLSGGAFSGIGMSLRRKR